MKQPPVLAIDLGTSSVRAALFDVRGRRMPGTMTQRAYVLRTDAGGAAELDPAELLRKTKACVKHALEGSGKISAVGVSCFWHSLIGVDEEGNPLTPVIMWADSRCRGDAARLRKELDEASVHAETGCMLRSSFWPAKLRWLRRTDRALWRQVKYWVSPGEWVQWRMAGRPRCAIGMATATGLFDPSRPAWSLRMLEVCALKETSMLEPGDEPSEWRGVPWFPAIGDGAASNLGSGASRPGIGAINFGTSAALRVMREGAEAKAPFGLFAYRVDARRFLVGGAVSNAGNLRAWCLRELNLDERGLEKALANRPAPDHGLIVLPFWNAERAPTWNENATGMIAGIRQSTTALDILQAVTEASYYRLARIASMVGGARWIVSGGILGSPSALRQLATSLDRTIYPSSEPEASLRGAAVFALEKLGFVPPLPGCGPAIKPSRAHVASHAAACRRLEDLENQLSP